MRSLEEIRVDLDEAMQGVESEDKEVYFHQEKSEEFSRDVEEYTKELRVTEFKLKLLNNK